MSMVLEAEQFTAVVHLKSKLKELLTDRPEIVSFAVIVIAFVPMSNGS